MARRQWVIKYSDFYLFHTHRSLKSDPVKVDIYLLLHVTCKIEVVLNFVVNDEFEHFF